jgi:hypothetical protein
VEHVEAQDAAAAIVHVVGVAIVRRAERDDRREAGRPARGNLERVEPAPGDAPHAELAVAPGLRAEPGEHLEHVLLLLLGVLVGQHPVGLPRAAHVHPHGRVAEPREVGLAGGVADRRAVRLAVGEELEDRGHRLVFCVLGQPHPRREPRPVGKPDPGVLDLPHAAGELGADGHQCPFR